MFLIKFLNQRRAFSMVIKMESQRYEELYKKYKGVLKGAVEGNVVTRFPPEPSGYLHIGHVKAAMLNYHYSRMYKGRMLLRFDDTNPSKEKQDFVDNIIDDLKRLEIYPDSISYTSDSFDKLAEYMEALITKGLAYMDNTPQEEMQKQRFDGIESICRNTSVEENLSIWKSFFEGNHAEYCVRGKINMQDKNKCMRDPVFYRHCDAPHHHTGDRFKVYPTYDFACPIVDSIEGVTHCLRTSEYNDRNPMYHWVINALGLRKVEIRDFSRLNFVNTLLSKRSLQKLVDTGIVEGWFDPRFPTVQGILRRGLLVETLKEFMLDQGPTKTTVYMDWSIIWSKNKQILDPIAPRYTAISTEKLCLVVLQNGPIEPKEEIHPLHPKNAEVGTGKIMFFHKIFVEFDDASTIQPGEKVTFMKWGNAIIHSISETTEEIQGLPLTLLLTGELLPEDKDFKSTKKLTWLAALPGLQKLRLVEYDVLINKAKVEDDDEVMDLININSKFVTNAIGSEGLRSLKEGVLQLERRGFYRVDKYEDETSEFIFIPDGKTKQMSTISSKVDPKKTSKGSEQPKPSKKINERAEKKKKLEEKKNEEKKKEENNEKTTEDSKSVEGEKKIEEVKAVEAVDVGKVDSNVAEVTEEVKKEHSEIKSDS